jgi:parallel beta-helix repeat protein
MQRSFRMTALVTVSLFTVSAAHATDRWVDASYTGSVSNGSSAQPFKKIGDAYSTTLPGDTVRVRPGTYYESVWIAGGTSNTARVTYKSEVKWGAKIVTPATEDNAGCFRYWGGGQIDNVSTPSVWGMTESNGHKIEPRGWVTIDGFDMHSNKIDSTGIGTWFQWVHHITIRNCWSHGNAMGGIWAGFSDYLTIENNVINDNAIGPCKYIRTDGTIGSLYGSGISIWKVRPWDTNSGSHNIIRSNIVFNNHNDLSDPDRSDGNGIIMDTTAFDKGTLIENNLIVNNGGAGILLDGSSNCLVRNNTLYQNSWDKSYPEIYAQKVDWEAGGTSNQENSICKNTTIYGNIIVALTNRLAIKTNNDNTNNVIHHNMRWYSGQALPTGVPSFFGNIGSLNDSVGVGDITGSDPQFINPGTNTWISDFHLQHYSAAINKNNTNTSDSKDLDGQTRSGTGNFVDLGAYEYKSFVLEPGFEGLSTFTAPYSSVASGGTFYIDTNNSKQHIGSKSMGIWVPSGPVRWNAARQTLTGLAPNTTYTITAWASNTIGTIGANSYLGTSTTGGIDRGSTTLTPQIGSYGKYIHTFNTGSLTSLNLYLGYNSPLNQNSVLQMDDISINVKTILPDPNIN